MKSIDLLSTTLEIAQTLVAKNGVLVPFCRTVTANGDIFFYSPETHDDDPNFRKAEANQRSIVLQEIATRKLIGLAFGKTVILTMKDPDEQVPAIKIELHQIDTKSRIFYFPYRVENGIVITQPHHELDTNQIELWTGSSE